MHLRCDGIFNDGFVANCAQSLPMKEFKKLANISQKYTQWQSGKFFGDSVHVNLLFIALLMTLSV